MLTREETRRVSYNALWCCSPAAKATDSKASSQGVAERPHDINHAQGEKESTERERDD